ncbi:MAG: glycosyltransferase, partial [Anaerolineales bacterium]|nr:glycosyltransferase [Anaerolineales bacterium]
MSEVNLSICIVTYQARDYLQACLRSVYENPPDGKYEVIIVDNHSSDGTLELLNNEFPEVKIIENADNLGFTAPMNQALQNGRGVYLLQLNPDTIIHPQAFNRLIAFMEAQQEVGICGPKVLNTDGSLQKPCRRDESRPWAVFTYFLGLSSLFPNSKLL